MNSSYDNCPNWVKTMDFIFNKAVPKKLIVFVVATTFCLLGLITGGQWLILAGAYAGVMYAQKLTQRISNGNRYSNNAGRNSGDLDSSDRRVHLDAEEPREASDTK